MHEGNGGLNIGGINGLNLGEKGRVGLKVVISEDVADVGVGNDLNLWWNRERVSTPWSTGRLQQYNEEQLTGTHPTPINSWTVTLRNHKYIANKRNIILLRYELVVVAPSVW